MTSGVDYNPATNPPTTPCTKPTCRYYDDKDTAASAHVHYDYQPFGRNATRPCETILSHVGNTPLVTINHLGIKAGLACTLLAKCEFFNAGGSVKDRIGKRMVEDAIAAGRIIPGKHTLIEPTSGNTGIGLALAAAIYGFRMIIVLPEKMSAEKVNVLKALGAEIVRTPNEAAWDSPESHIGVAKRLEAEIPDAIILDQYSNLSNPLAHYDQTAEEILEGCEGVVDMVVIGAGTGGTISGIAAKLKEKCPKVIVVGVDPVGSILAQPESLNEHNRLVGYQVEGIGYDFIPQVLDRSLVDSWIKMNDKDAFVMARRLIREEGLLCGGSCGSAMAAALVAAKDLKAGQKCVVILADSTRNYMTKFLKDSWMIEHGYAEALKIPVPNVWWSQKRVVDLDLQSPVILSTHVTCREAVELLRSHGFDMFPVMDRDTILGIVSEGNLTALLTSGKLSPSDSIARAVYKQFHTVTLETPLGDLTRIFENDPFVLVTRSQQHVGEAGTIQSRDIVFGIVARIDLLLYITKHQPSTSTSRTEEEVMCQP